MGDTCGDNRFELIDKYKQKLLDATNIVDSPEEMAVIDNVLFRFWQMGWLATDTNVGGNLISRQAALEAVRKAKDKSEAHRMLIQLPPAQPEIIRCKDCKSYEEVHWETVNKYPVIVANHVCMKWGKGCQTDPDGYCFLAERKDGDHETD